MIFYFSMTGNGANVARVISERTGERAVDVARLLAADKDGAHPFTFDLAAGERLGFVAPTYFWGLPRPVEDFVTRLGLTVDGRPLVGGAGEHERTDESGDAAPGANGPKASTDQPGDAPREPALPFAYVVLTYGTTPGQAPRQLADLVRARLGVQVAARHAVRMVDTWTPMFDLSDPARNQRVTDAAQPMIREVARSVCAREPGDFCPRLRPPALAVRISRAFYGPMSATSRFAVTDSCVGCGLCARRCPARAIEMRDGRPAWTRGHCALCLGCLHRCPKASIEYGPSDASRRRTRAHGQFTNPYARRGPA